MSGPSSCFSRQLLSHRKKRYSGEMSSDLEYSNAVLPAKRLHLEPRENAGSDEKGATVEIGNISGAGSVSHLTPNEFMRSSHRITSNAVSESKDNRDPSLLILNLSCKAEVNHEVAFSANCSSNASLASDEYNKENSEDGNSGPIDLSKGQRLFVCENGQGNQDGAFVDRLTTTFDKRTIRQLQEELRNEEMKLVLLKKIQMNQQMHCTVRDLSRSGRSSSPASQQLPRPPPLIHSDRQRGHTMHRSVHHSANHLSLSPYGSCSQSIPPPLAASSLRPSTGVVIPTMKSVHGFVPPARSQNPVSSVQNHSTPPVTTSTPQRMQPPPPLPRLLPPSTLPSVTPSPLQVEQTPAQRQAAAKVALRKQLEKTLLQIPPPKPPPPEMNFIPNISSSDFVALLGLEEVVKCILDSDARERGEQVSEVKYIFNPFQCIQCHTDFTPVWKRDKPGSKNVICERCVMSNQKRALKQEHTDRLKSAFVKALQQEQEIDRTLLAPGIISAPAHSLVSVASLLPKNISPGPKLIASSSSHQESHQSVIWTPPMIGSMAGLSSTFNQHLMFPFHRLPAATKSSIEFQRQFMMELMPRQTHLDGSPLWQT